MGQYLSCFGIDSSTIQVEGRRYVLKQKLGEGYVCVFVYAL